MKKSGIGFLVSFIFLMGISAVGFSQQLLDKVVAVVNSHVITQSQVSQQMHIMQSQLAASGQSVSSSQQLRQKVIDQLIDNALEKDVAQKANIKVTDDELNQTIEKIAAQNNSTVPQMLKVISAHGLSEKAYKDQIREQLLIHKVEAKMLAPLVMVSKEDLAKAIKMPKPSVEIPNNNHTQYHVIDLLFSSKDNAELALGKLQQLNLMGKTNDEVKKIFADLHAKNVAMNDMGYRALSLFPNAFIKSVSHLSPGQFSSVIQAPNGSHILFLVSMSGKEAQMPASPALSPDQLAFQNKFNEERQNWLRKLRSQSYVKVMG